MAVTQLTCPECGATLTLRSNAPLPPGSRIKCPKCGTSVRADSPDDRPVRTVKAVPRRAGDEDDDERPRARRRPDPYDDEDDDRPRRRRRRPRDDEEDDADEGPSSGLVARYVVGAILLIAAIIVNYFIWTERAKKAEAVKERGDAAPAARHVAASPDEWRSARGPAPA
jgi:hypothetical protein